MAPLNTFQLKIEFSVSSSARCSFCLSTSAPKKMCRQGVRALGRLQSICSSHRRCIRFLLPGTPASRTLDYIVQYQNVHRQSASYFLHFCDDTRTATLPQKLQEEAVLVEEMRKLQRTSLSTLRNRTIHFSRGTLLVHNSSDDSKSATRGTYRYTIPTPQTSVLGLTLDIV